MQLIIDLPSRDETLANIRECWGVAIADPQWRKVEGRFETNAFGQVIVTLPPPFFHNARSFRIATILEQTLGGRGIVECPILTIDGIKVADAGWLSSSLSESVKQQIAIETAPEICVEVVSPSNTDAEMRHKRKLYFEAGAIECWTCDPQGQMQYYTADEPMTAQTKSTLCPDFPNQIKD